ncbi:hypothetical protein U1Q18_032228 [Sarracenia purpurea var. burkii]
MVPKSIQVKESKIEVMSKGRNSALHVFDQMSKPICPAIDILESAEGVAIDKPPNPKVQDGAIRCVFGAWEVLSMVVSSLFEFSCFGEASWWLFEGQQVELCVGVCFGSGRKVIVAHTPLGEWGCSASL